MTRLRPGSVTDAAVVESDWEPVPAGQLVAGAPATRYVDVDDAAGRCIGVWEMSPGAMRDVEADEVFVVIAGSATVAFDDPPLASIELQPGSVVRLTAGMQTLWTVHETLRKVYVSP